MPYRLSKQAEKDIEDILVQGILRFGEYQAARYQASLHHVFDLLSDMPLLGRKTERDRPNERRFVHNMHVIYYVIEDNGVVIEAIIYGPFVTDLLGES